MENSIHEETRHGLTIKIYQDDDPLNPRTEWDNLGTMACFHKRYSLGDKHNLTPDELKELVKRYNLLALPLYLLDHSGLWIRTGRFAEDAAGWDTSFIGYIYVTFETIKKEYGKVTKKTKAQALSVLEGEVKVYSAYLEGSVYGFVVEDETGNNLESCWGFIETDYPMEKTYVLQEARSVVDSLTHNGTTTAEGQEVMTFAQA